MRKRRWPATKTGPEWTELRRGPSHLLRAFDGSLSVGEVSAPAPDFPWIRAVMSTARQFALRGITQHAIHSPLVFLFRGGAVQPRECRFHNRLHKRKTELAWCELSAPRCHAHDGA